MKPILPLLCIVMLASCDNRDCKEHEDTLPQAIPIYTAEEAYDGPGWYTAPPVPEPIQDDTALAEIIASFESFSPTVYRCPAGKRTIGYGFTEQKYLDMAPMTKEQAWSILINEIIPEHREIVRRHVRVPLTEGQEAALISFTFNCGEGSLISLVSKDGRLNDGNYQATAKAMRLYCKAKVKGKYVTLRGLSKRRNVESELFNA